MIASLPMYDTPTTRAANDRLWQAIAARLDLSDISLNRQQDPHRTWLNPDLVLSQTCGMPYRTELHGKARLIGTPDYGVSGCAPGYYRSWIIKRVDDPRAGPEAFATARLARNDVRSQSGWAALWHHFKPLGGFRGDILDTGAHAASVTAVAQGQADFAAIDAVTWALLQRDAPEVTEGVETLAQTAPTPGLPYITGPKYAPDVLFNAVQGAIDALATDDRECLLLKGLVAIPARDYLAVPTP